MQLRTRHSVQNYHDLTLVHGGLVGPAFRQRSKDIRYPENVCFEGNRFALAPIRIARSVGALMMRQHDFRDLLCSAYGTKNFGGHDGMTFDYSPFFKRQVV